MVSTTRTMKLQSRLHKQKVFYSLSGCGVKSPGEENTIKKWGDFLFCSKCLLAISFSFLPACLLAVSNTQGQQDAILLVFITVTERTDRAKSHREKRGNNKHLRLFVKSETGDRSSLTDFFFPDRWPRVAPHLSTRTETEQRESAEVHIPASNKWKWIST